MRTILLAALVCTLGCGGRSIVVQNPPPQSAVSIKVTNSLALAVNVYVTGTEAEIFLAQVAANSTSSLPVRNINPGTMVKLRAVTQDGSKTYMREGVELRDGYEWRVP
ncbi:MAG TPA: hypothetical protein VH762_02345 [Gemmatimonadaceae bacterium]|jgi:hypothetical protein